MTLVPILRYILLRAGSGYTHMLGAPGAAEKVLERWWTMNWMAKISLSLAGGLLAAGCSLGGVGGPTATPTLSSDDVLQTAEAMAELTRQAASPTPSPSPVTPTATEVLETATPESTATPSSARVTANYNANVRTGPDEVFEVIDFLLQGDQAQPIGRYENEATGTWWYITREEGLDGWVWGGAVTFSGNEATVPFRDSPPTPTPGPGPTETPTPTPLDGTP